MNRFVVLYHAPEEVAERFARASPEEAAVGMRAWTDWIERVGPALVDPGAPLANPVTVTTSGHAKSGSDVVGMSILRAESMNAALALVNDHHHLRWADGCEITLLEEIAIPETAA